MSLILSLAPVKAQLSNGKIAAGKLISQRQANTRHVTGDTLAFHRLNKRFLAEVLKRGELDMDTLRFFGYRAIREGNALNYDRGLIRTYLGLGSGYVSKVVIDSAKFYYSQAIKRAAEIRDTSLLSKAYSG